MHNPLLRRIHIEQPHAKLFAVSLQRRNLFSRNQIGNRSSARLGRNIVIHRSYRPRRLPHLSSGNSQAVESLWRSHLMHQMQIDINNGRPPTRLRHQVRVPNLLEKCFLLCHGFRFRRAESSFQFFTERQTGASAEPVRRPPSSAVRSSESRHFFRKSIDSHPAQVAESKTRYSSP